MAEVIQVFLAKAEQSLDGAESEFISRRYDNCANRCYYACFQAAVAALVEAGIQPIGTQWSHRFVPAQFDGQLINRRKLYLTNLRNILARNYALRQRADYDIARSVSAIEASRALQRARTFLAAVQQQIQPGGNV